MKVSNEKINVTIGLDADRTLTKLEENYKKLGLVLPEGKQERILLVEKIAKEIFEALGESGFGYSFEHTLRMHIAEGNLSRERNMISDEARSDTFPLANTKAEIEKILPKMLKKYTDRNKPTAISKAQYTSLIEEMAFEEFPPELSLTCYPILQEGYPIELLHDIGIEKDALRPYLLTISQIEMLLMRKKVHRHLIDKKPHNGRYHLFPLKRIDGEPRLLKAYIGDGPLEGRTYAVYHFTPQGGYEYYPIEKRSRFYLPDIDPLV